MATLVIFQQRFPLVQLVRHLWTRAFVGMKAAFAMIDLYREGGQEHFGLHLRCRDKDMLVNHVTLKSSSASVGLSQSLSSAIVLTVGGFIIVFCCHRNDSLF